MMMRSLTALLFMAPFASAFSSSFLSGSSSLSNGIPHAGGKCSRLTMEYIPSGMSKEQWRKIKEQEKSKNQGKDLSRVGITTFKSRSFVDWQKSGGKNLFPVNPKTVKDPSEVPYMQRPGGRPDGSDLKKGGGFFSFGAKPKKEEKEVPPPKPKSTNWWTLN